jgi:hypothetical protein
MLDRRRRQRRTNPRQVMVAVTNGVIFEEELARHRRVRVAGNGRRAIEFASDSRRAPVRGISTVGEVSWF